MARPKSFSFRILLLLYSACDAVNGRNCVDQHALCPFWATDSEDQCTKNKAYMSVNCPVSCASEECDGWRIKLNCTDQNRDCEEWSRRGECQKTPFYMLWQCPRACGYCTKSGNAAYPYSLTDALDAPETTTTTVQEVSGATPTTLKTTKRPPKSNASSLFGGGNRGANCSSSVPSGYKLFSNVDCQNKKYEVPGGMTCEYNANIALQKCAADCREDKDCRGFVYTVERGVNFFRNSLPACAALCVQKSFGCNKNKGLTAARGYHWYLKLDSASASNTKQINVSNPLGC